MKWFVFLIAVISLTACTSTPPHKPIAHPVKTWDQRKIVLSKINHWHINGRIAIINGDESWNLNMEWQRHDGKYILDLSGPFGAGHAQLTGIDEEVVLVDSDKNYFYSDSPERLLQEVTGVKMPVTSLLYWMRGIPNWNIKEQKEKVDEFGRLYQLEQDGWRIRFKRYIDVAKYELPQKVFIDGHDLKVKIFVDEWNLKTNKFKSMKEEN